MEDSFRKDNREDIFSLVVRAGKRTYFMDVKEMRSGEKYLTITESKRRFNNESGKFFYEKHKIFLYREDFEKFSFGLNGVIDYIETGKEPVVEPEEKKPSDFDDFSFDDLKGDTAARTTAADPDDDLKTE